MNRPAAGRGGVSIWIVALLGSVLSLAQGAAGVEVLEDMIEQKYVLDRDATLSISNIDGSIRVYAGDAGEISIQAIKRAYTLNRFNTFLM